MKMWQLALGGLELALPSQYKIQILSNKLPMTSKIILDNVTFQNNPAPFLDNLLLDITFTALQPISVPIQWKIIYVGSAKSQQHDQILEEFEVGPINEPSTMKFTIDCGCADYTKIPADELICVTALIITITYRGQEFIRVGYYVHNVLDENMREQEQTLPVSDLIKHTTRTILTQKPRITNFKIKWTEGQQNQIDNSMDRVRSENAQNSSYSTVRQQQQAVQQQEKHETKEQKENQSQQIAKQEGQCSHKDAVSKQQVIQFQ